MELWHTDTMKLNIVIRRILQFIQLAEFSSPPSFQFCLSAHQMLPSLIYTHLPLFLLLPPVNGWLVLSHSIEALSHCSKVKTSICIAKNAVHLWLGKTCDSCSPNLNFPSDKKLFKIYRTITVLAKRGQMTSMIITQDASDIDVPCKPDTTGFIQSMDTNKN
jgi:hypothetical protein